MCRVRGSPLRTCLGGFAFSLLYFTVLKKITNFSGGKNSVLFHYKELK